MLHRPSRLCRLLLTAITLKLCLISTLLMAPASDALRGGWRLLHKAGSAVMQTSGPLHPAPPAVAAPEFPLFAPAAHAAASPPAPQAQPQEEPGALARDALARRQEELARREQDLRNLSKDLDDRLERLQALELRLKAMLKEADEMKSEKFRQLVDMLANMKAKQAAAVLETLDEKIAVKVLSGMRGRQSGEILTYVNPAKAARLSESLARIQLPFE